MAEASNDPASAAAAAAAAAADESLRELVDEFWPQIREHLRHPHRLFPHLDLSLLPFRTSAVIYRALCMSYTVQT